MGYVRYRNHLFHAISFQAPELFSKIQFLWNDGLVFSLQTSPTYSLNLEFDHRSKVSARNIIITTQKVFRTFEKRQQKGLLVFC